MIGCVLMAAGQSTRFGTENKLLAQYGGVPLVFRAMDAVPPECRTVVVTGYAEIAAEAARRGFAVVRNDRPQDGASRTVRLGTAALADCEAILFLVGDQPLLRRDAVARVLDCYRAHPACICAGASGGKRGNPCIFPREFFAELCAVTGDRGGSAVIRQHEDRLLLVELPPEALRDVDTGAALAALKEEHHETETDRP